MSVLYYNIGDKYGDREIIDTAPPRIYKNGSRTKYVKVRCKCGREDIVRLNVLIKGKANQCTDCVHRSQMKGPEAIHKQIWYHIWNGIMQRCYNPKNKRYYDYGGRGVKVCDEWLDANVFGKWAEENGYKKGLQIDRIDNDGNYEPSNCRFVTPKENMQNRRNTIYAIIGRVKKSVRTWCEIYNINFNAVCYYHEYKNLSWKHSIYLAVGHKICDERVSINIEESKNT